MSAKSQRKQDPRLLYGIQDITNAGAASEPETLNMVFNSKDAAELYIKHFGKPGWRPEIIGRAISLGDIQLMLSGKFNVVGSKVPPLDTPFLNRLRASLLTGIRYSEHLNA